MPKVIKHRFRGEILSLPEIIRKYNINTPYQTLNARIHRSGWSVERAITEPSVNRGDIEPTAEWKALSNKPRDYNLW